ncbi:MAG: PorV/PorQ family protein [Elusimicrobia bacterium]|nr:PorV/PorQ family protein [Elusimicrobiota bacterium]
MAPVVLAAVLLLAPLPALAGPGATAANFLKVGVGARPVALGEAYTALADDVNAVYYNPAGLAFLQRQEVTAMHNKFFDGVSQQFAAYAYPSVRFGTFSGAFMMLSVEPFDAYDNFDQRSGEVSAADLAGAAAWGFELPWPRNMAVGGSFKYIHSRLSSYTAQAAAVDLGMLWRQADDGGWSMGVAARNVGTDMRFISEAFPLPVSGHVGLAYRGGLAPVWADASYTFLVEGVGSRDRDPYAGVGLEFRPVDEFALRTGWRQSQDVGTGLSAGIGFRSLEKGFTGDWWPEVSLDYAFVDYGRLAATHRVSVTLRFGTPKDERREGAERRAPKFHNLIRY